MAKVDGWGKMYYKFGERAEGGLLRKVHLLSLLLCALFWLCLPSAIQAQGEVVFDDSAPDRIQIRNDAYALTLSKTNGAITGLTDLQAGSQLTTGSQKGCLWRIEFDRALNHQRGGCDYAAGAIDSFTYRWDEISTTLVMTYTSRSQAAQGLTAVATIWATAQAFFDLQLKLVNGYSTDGTSVIRSVEWPAALVMEEAAVEWAYAPFPSPGVRLDPRFFAEDRGALVTYPSDWAFADFLALDSAGGHLALYTVNPAPAPIQPVRLGFSDEPIPNPTRFSLYHSLYSWIKPGATWQSQTVRIRVGQPVVESIRAYRIDNSIDAYPSLADKLGEQQSQFLRAPLIKMDLHHIGKPFAQLMTDLARLPTPALIHPVAFQLRGHDEQGPDYLPPDSRWGTVADFRAFTQAAQQLGLLVMPYTNPTWWDEESPTLQNLAPLTIADIAVQTTPKQPTYERYGTHGGYTVTPYHPFVQQRLAQLLAQWQTAVPVDCVFDDQIGARAWNYDFNPVAPTPLAYSDGWLAYTQKYADQCLMTEMGWDRLAATEVGFHGTLLTWARSTEGVTKRLGAGNWTPYPLANWLYGDKVLFYQHNLAGETMTGDPGVLTWNLAFGTMLSYALVDSDYDPLGNPWLELTGVLQQTVVARLAGRLLDSYQERSREVTESRFGDMTVLANWSPLLTYDIDGHRIAPGGFYVDSTDQSVMAGVFSHRFNNGPLSPGEHYLVLERAPDGVTIHQPLGAQTVLLVDAPERWQPGQKLELSAFDHAGQRLGQVDFSLLEDRRVRFVYRSAWNGKPISYYALTMIRQ